MDLRISWKETENERGTITAETDTDSFFFLLELILSGFFLLLIGLNSRLFPILGIGVPQQLCLKYYYLLQNLISCMLCIDVYTFN